MKKVLQEVKELRKEVQNIKAFCSYVAEAHDHMPHLRRVWNQVVAGNHIYEAYIEYEDLMLMQSIIKLEKRIRELEQAE